MRLIDSRSEDEQGVNIVIDKGIASCIMDTQNLFNNLLSSVKYVTLYGKRSSWSIVEREMGIWTRHQERYSQEPNDD